MPATQEERDSAIRFLVDQNMTVGQVCEGLLLTQAEVLAGIARLARAAAPLDELLDAATAHGEASAPDHEVGDLQDILRTCWALLTPEQRTTVYNEHADLVEEWLPKSAVATKTPATTAPTTTAYHCADCGAPVPGEVCATHPHANLLTGPLR